MKKPALGGADDCFVGGSMATTNTPLLFPCGFLYCFEPRFHDIRLPDKTSHTHSPPSAGFFLHAIAAEGFTNKRSPSEDGIIRGLTPDQYSAASPLDCWLLPLPTTRGESRDRDG